MPTHDMRGEEVPVGKVERRLRYDRLAATESPTWMTRVGAASESKDDTASSRGELHLSMTDGVVRIGFNNADGTSDPENWCYYREPGESGTGHGPFVSCGRLSFGRDGEETSTGNLAIVLDASGGAAVLEIRIRPFERDATVTIGGAGRGDVAYEDADCPFAFVGPVRPTIRTDASENTETEQLSLASVELSALHN